MSLMEGKRSLNETAIMFLSAYELVSTQCVGRKHHCGFGKKRVSSPDDFSFHNTFKKKKKNYAKTTILETTGGYSDFVS